MENTGQIVGGGLKEIYIREKSDSRMELGDLLVADGDESDYILMQVKDISYRSQVPQSSLDMSAGMKLEGYGDNLEFMQSELRNYTITRAKALLKVEKKDENYYKTKSPKRLPKFFNAIRSVSPDDLKFLEPEKIKNQLYLGHIRNGSKKLKDIDVYIDAKDALTHHILIPATTGRGKSNLVKVMLWSLLDTEDIGILVLDPHDEYYGRDETGLKDHLNSDDKLRYYSTDAKGTKGSDLMIHIESIKPNHFDGIISFTDAQNDAIRKLYNNNPTKWIEKLFVTQKLDDVQPTTLSVLKRKFENILKIKPNNEKLEYIKGSKNIFRFGQSGESHLDKIIDYLKKGNVIIIDTSKLNDYQELLVGSIIAGTLFNEYKKYGTKKLSQEPVISIVIEEAPRVLGNEILARGDNIYSTIAREGRKFNIGLIAITQLASLIPRTVLANMNTKIILGNEMGVERRAIIESASQDLSDDDRIIASLDKGEAIVSSIFTKFAVPIYTKEFKKYVQEYLQVNPTQPKVQEHQNSKLITMYKFAHIADCHLGAQKYPELKVLEFEAFKRSMDICMDEKVDFIIIAGDLFHSNIPDMGIVRDVVRKLKEVNENGISIYITYGSHDFSPNATSMIDIITESGLLKNIVEGRVEKNSDNEEILKLNFIIDPTTKAKITGIYGRKTGIEKHFYEILDTESLEKSEGFKIFVFHTSIEELIPKFLSMMEGVSINRFPSGFDYYAGGHIHKKIFEDSITDFKPIVYPGPLFAGDMRDLEENAKNNQNSKRGFFIVEFDEKVRDVSFHEIKLADYKYLQFDADQKTSHQLYDEIRDKIDDYSFDDQIVIIKVKGQLEGGKTSDIDFNQIRRSLRNKNALYVGINHHSLVSKEFKGVKLEAETKDEIEENLLKENIINVNVKTKTLIERQGVELAIKLINTLKKSSKTNEKKSDYKNRISKKALKILEGKVDDI